MRAGKAEADPMTFLVSGFLIVGGFVLLAFVFALLDPLWQPLFGVPAILFIVFGAFTYIRELILFFRQPKEAPVPDSLQGGLDNAK